MKGNRGAACLVARSKVGFAILATIAAIDLHSSTNPATEISHPDLAVASAGTSRPEELPPSVRERRVPQARKRVWNASERLAATPLDHAASAPDPAQETLVLPKITVTAEKERPSLPPQLHFDTPVKDLPAPDFESLTGRSARLVQKHFTSFEQKLGRIIGKESLESSAKNKEAIESAALELNRIANVLEVSAPVEQEDAETQKKIHDEFLRAYYQRPR
jgi:hypothetical protein